MTNEITAEDVKIFLDKTYYTRAGALKLMDIKSTTLSREIREKRISVFKHPNGDLFSKDAIEAWIIRRTCRAK